ncbi:MAG TPA: orotate phosphoribosyltransferase [Thermoanaerobaculia bacterium]|nr:orotate phosphoribosyltransferase [Thermoanaerobaculia bacterium]HUM30706.1 orotate phosphoribosyltransferase [Thermoanaerobaculia bacterium]HXK68886.1 orotate phosphoribosyltransferase [Thermoanaerobaculia bacterium]
MTSEIQSLLLQSGALLEGHFILSSGKHSSNYLQCAVMLQHPEFATRAGLLLGDLLQPYNLDLVISPAIGGIVIGQEVGRALGKRAIFAEREKGVMTLRRGFLIQPGDRVGIVEDVVTTGGSVKEVIKAVSEAGGVPAVVGSLVFRTKESPFTVPYEYLWQVIFPVYDQDECPLCAKGSQAVKPGSRS